MISINKRQIAARTIYAWEDDIRDSFRTMGVPATISLSRDPKFPWDAVIIPLMGATFRPVGIQLIYKGGPFIPYRDMREWKPWSKQPDKVSYNPMFVANPLDPFGRLHGWICIIEENRVEWIAANRVTPIDAWDWPDYSIPQDAEVIKAEQFGLSESMLKRILGI